MKACIDHPKYGRIVYEEGIWTGKKTLSVDGFVFEKQTRTKYTCTTEDSYMSAELKGSFMTGVEVRINGGDRITLLRKTQWYEILLAILPFVFVLTWGNSAALCKIFPMIGGVVVGASVSGLTGATIGGAVSGAISGLIMVVSFLIIKNRKSVWGKLLCAVIAFAATVLICWLVALLWISAFSKK